MEHAAVHRSIDAVWRAESPKVIAALLRMVRDLDLAEELAQDALVTALERWPSGGVPDNPGAWLMAAAKNRAIDHLRRQQLQARKHAQIADELEGLHDELHEARQAAFDDDIGDDLLRLVFVACHPLLSMEARVALTLRLLCGLSTDEIARAFLVPESTMAQRIVRAKKRLASERPSIELPTGEARQARVASVLDVLYLVFNEGYAATSGDALVRRNLCDEARRLARLLVDVAPLEAEAHGLAALMDLQASRLDARIDAAGNPVLLLDQDRGRWRHDLIRDGLARLDEALRLAPRPGVFTTQAAIAACHGRAATAADTDWRAIVAWYSVLHALSPSPVVALNRAVAVSMADGPAAALPLVEALADEPVLKGYHYVPAVRADLLRKLGREDEARAEFARAAALTANERERAALMAEASRVH